jgi:hypothetical protein
MSENDREKRRLTAKQRRAIEALLSGATKGQAADAAGVTPRTLSRWRSLPEFDDELRWRSNQAIDDATRRLTGGLDRMVDVLLAVAEDAESPASVRVRAALGWINAQVKLVELNEVIERLEALESVVHGVK